MSKLEIWRPVIGFEFFYEASNLGNVRSIKNNNRYRPNQSKKILIGGITIWGYRQITLSILGTQKTVRVCRIIATAFIPNPNNKPCVNHKNGIKTDDRAENLEWVTYSENEHHSYDILKKNIKGIKKTLPNGISYHAKSIYCFENKTIYKSIKLASDALGVFRSNITKQIKGELKQTGGYTFKLI